MFFTAVRHCQTFESVTQIGAFSTIWLSQDLLWCDAAWHGSSMRGQRGHGLTINCKGIQSTGPLGLRLTWAILARTPRPMNRGNKEARCLFPLFFGKLRKIPGIPKTRISDCLRMRQNMAISKEARTLPQSLVDSDGSWLSPTRARFAPGA